MRSAWNPHGSAPRELLLRALDVPVDLVVWGTGADDLIVALAEPWAWCQRNGPAGPAQDPVKVHVFLDSDPAHVALARQHGLVASTDVQEAMHDLSSRITLAAIERRAGQLWMLHAACVADPSTGAAVAMVAPSGGGKTTLARTLSSRWAYVTDETTAVDRDGRITPYPKPFSVKDGHARVKQQVGPSTLGLVAPDVVPRLRAVLVISRDGTTPPTVQPLSVGEALPRLAEQTSYVARFERPLRFMADVLALTDGVFQVSYAEARDLEPIVAELLGAS